LEKIVANGEARPGIQLVGKLKRVYASLLEAERELTRGRGWVVGCVGTDISPSAPTYAFCKKFAK
jgi:hypothetical protein